MDVSLNHEENFKMPIGVGSVNRALTQSVKNKTTSELVGMLHEEQRALNSAINSREQRIQNIKDAIIDTVPIENEIPGVTPLYDKKIVFYGCYPEKTNIEREIPKELVKYGKRIDNARGFRDIAAATASMIAGATGFVSVMGAGPTSGATLAGLPIAGGFAGLAGTASKMNMSRNLTDKILSQPKLGECLQQGIIPVPYKDKVYGMTIKQADSIFSPNQIDAGPQKFSEILLEALTNRYKELIRVFGVKRNGRWEAPSNESILHTAEMINSLKAQMQ